MDVQLLAPYQDSLALLGLYIGAFLGEDNANAAPCTFLMVIDALLAVRPSTFADITASTTEGI